MRHLDLAELGQEARALVAGIGPAEAFTGAAHHAVQVQAQRAPAVARGRHRRHVPGHQDLGIPGLVVLGRGAVPVAVPVVVEVPFAGDHLIADAAGDADHEVVAGAAIAIEVHHHVHPVLLAHLVASGALGGARHVRGLGVAERHGQALGRRQHPGLGGQGGGLAGQRLQQAEIGDVAGTVPFAGREAAVHDHGGRGEGRTGQAGQCGEQTKGRHAGAARRSGRHHPACRRLGRGP